VDALLVGIFAQRLPLSEEEELVQNLTLDAGLVFTCKDLQCLGIAPAQRFGPLIPANPALGFLNSHEKCKIGQPVSLLFLKGQEFLLQVAVGHFLEPLGGAVEQGQFPRDDAAVIDFFGRENGPVGKILAFQQAILHEQRRADQVRITGKGRKALIRRVSVTRGTKGQHLPEATLGTGQKIDPSVGFGP